MELLQHFEERGVLANVRSRSEQLKAGLLALAEQTGCVAEVRGWGLLLGMELTADCGFTAAQLTAACLKEGLLTVPAGTAVLRLVPPLVVSEAEAAEALERLGTALQACIAEHGANKI